MGGGNKGYNFTIRARSDGKREFYHSEHDNRDSNYDDNDEGRSSGYNNNNNRSKNIRGQLYQNRSNQNQRGNWRGSRRGQRGSSWRGRSTITRRYPNDGDIDMSNEKGGRYQQFYKRRSGLRKSTRNISYRPKSSINDNSGWHKITVQNVNAKYKNEVMTIIKDSVEDLFTAILFDEEGKNLVFYLERQFQIASAILTLSGRLKLSNDKILNFSCSDTTPPSQKLTESQMAIILNVMSDRYSVEMKRLDLKNFHNDPTLIQEQIFCPLHRDLHILAILDIIVKHIPNVEEIDFSSNQIINLNEFESLKECHYIKSLNLENNKIKLINNMSALKNLPIQELNLSGNSIKDKYYDSKTYRINVAKYFPKLKILDGVEVDRPIGFAVETECITLPKSRGSFFCTESAKQIVTQFMEQYYQVYESNDRRALEAAYTEDAYFSLTASFPDGGHNTKYIGVFLRESRNLHTITITEKKHRLLSKGRIDVVNSICRLPIVSHDPNSFILDIPLAKPQLIHVVLMGVFKQIIDSESPIRSFTRTLVIVPVGEGFCICNEELFIGAATVDQIRKSFKSPPVSAPLPVMTATVESPVRSDVSSEAFIGLSDIKKEMIKQFAKDSKMLPEYCRVCLEQKNWDYAVAGSQFMNLQKQNLIPPEYFGRLT